MLFIILTVLCPNGYAESPFFFTDPSGTLEFKKRIVTQIKYNN